MAYQMDRQVFAQNLRKYRKGNRLSQQQVADAVGIDRSTYAYYELGHSVPRIDTAVKLARLFNVAFNSFAGAEKHIEKPSSDFHYLKLTPTEQSIIIRIRLLSPAQKKDLLESLGG